MKNGIVITRENRNMLLGRFTTALDVEQLPLGYILVADFGDEDTFEVMTTTVFNNHYVVNSIIENGFFDIGDKP
jgi:hypothetical protein